MTDLEHKLGQGIIDITRHLMAGKNLQALDLGLDLTVLFEAARVKYGQDLDAEAEAAEAKQQAGYCNRMDGPPDDGKP